METHYHLPYMREIILFLIVAALLVPAFQRLRVSPTLGFVFIGMLLGPYFLGMLAKDIDFLKYVVFEDTEGVKALAELGIMFLLFKVGLELTGERLWASRHLIFGLGFLQVLLCAIAISALLWLIGYEPQIAILIGACLALSSTAMVVQMLIEKGTFSSPLGKTSFSVLLFQDLAVVPIVLFIGFLGAGTGNNLALSLIHAFATAILVVALIVVLGRTVLRPLFRLVTLRNSPEFFMAMTLLVIIGTSFTTASAGLSMALGAFLAGLLLAETEFRHQIEIDIQPFKGLFMGLFFMSIGMSIDWRLIVQEVEWILLGLFGLITLKMIITTTIALAFKIPRHIALSTGVLLAQGGEFCFVIIAIATSTGLIPDATAQMVIVIACLSMMLTPLMMSAALWIKDNLNQDVRADHPYKLTEDEEGLSGHVIIVGFGRFGEIIAKMLHAQQTPYVAVDRNGSRVSKMKKDGHPVLFGNAGRKEVLSALQADKASALIITIDTAETASQIVKMSRKNWPNLPVFARVYDHAHGESLMDIGAARVVDETSEAGIRLAGFALNALGVPNESVNAITEKLRDEYTQYSRDQIQKGSEETASSDDAGLDSPAVDTPIGMDEDDHHPKEPSGGGVKSAA